MPAPVRKPTASRNSRRRASWGAYEAGKAPLAAAGLDPLKYAREVRRLARKLGV